MVGTVGHGKKAKPNNSALVSARAKLEWVKSRDRNLVRRCAVSRRVVRKERGALPMPSAQQ